MVSTLNAFPCLLVKPSSNRICEMRRIPSCWLAYRSKIRLSHLVLRHACHDGQSELAVRVECVDVVVLEQDADVMLQKLLRVLDAVLRRTREAGYPLRDDKIETPIFGVLYHPKEATVILEV